jgi:antirestriction protein ArdC
MEKGIAQDDIRPRENVFTLFAWNALGRRIRKGEHGVHVITFVEGSAPSKNPADVNPDGSVKVKGYKMARTSTVFHISQTEPTT